MSQLNSACVIIENGPTSMEHSDLELTLPKTPSLVCILVANLLLQISFFIIVSSSDEYAEHLGGTSTFSGVVIGIPTVFSGLALIPMMKLDGGGYKLPLHISCAASILGHILYAVAYQADYLYLILFGRITSGFGFSMWMYCKKYCTDARIVGIRRRTTLASWLVIGQGLGMSTGPFVGGLLYKVGFRSSVFNGYTSPGWIMAVIWTVFWVCTIIWYEDLPKESGTRSGTTIELPAANMSSGSDSKAISPSESQKRQDACTNSIPAQLSSPLNIGHMRGMTYGQWGVVVCMCWFAMTCFFILGAWESNLPVSGAHLPQFHWSPFASGNFIALGGITTFPFLLINLSIARQTQDRKILAFGCLLGLLGLLVFIALLQTRTVHYWSLFVCWWAVALGFNLASTVTLSLLSKQLPPESNTWTSLVIQYSNYAGRVCGAVWGGSGVQVGMLNYVELEVAIVAIGGVQLLVLWRDLKAKKG